MNERIQELAKQAGGEFYPGFAGSPNSVKFMEENFEKFAELIVRECAQFLEENSGYDDSNNAWHPEPEDLLEHFGVEE
jgi:hypothetical protein